MFGRRSATARIEPRLSAPETRAATTDYGPGWGGLAAMARAGGGVSPAAAEGLSAVLACVGLLSSSAASLPASIVQDGPGGLTPAPPTLPAVRLLRRPNPRQSWSGFISTTAASILLHGNALAWVQVDGRGAVSSVTPIPWPWIAPRIVGAPGRARLVYDVVQSSAEAALLGVPRRLLDTDVLHIRARSDNGIIGRSVLSRAAGPVREGIELNTVAEATWVNGMRPSGALMSEQQITPEGGARLRARLEDFRGSTNASKVLILEQGLKFSPMSLNPADAELLQSRRFSVAEICRLFGVPEPLLQVGQNAPNSYTPVIAAFATLGLSPLVTAIEEEFSAAVLPPGSWLQLDMSGLQRGDYPAVAAAQAVLVQSGIATGNDARFALGLPSHPQGDELRPNGAPPNYPADATGVPSLAPKPGPGDGGGGGLPNVGTHQNEGAR